MQLPLEHKLVLVPSRKSSKAVRVRVKAKVPVVTAPHTVERRQLPLTSQEALSLSNHIGTSVQNIPNKSNEWYMAPSQQSGKACPACKFVNPAGEYFCTVCTGHLDSLQFSSLKSSVSSRSSLDGVAKLKKKSTTLKGCCHNKELKFDRRSKQAAGVDDDDDDDDDDDGYVPPAKGSKEAKKANPECKQQ